MTIDSYSCSLWGLEGRDILLITKAYEYGFGEIDLSKVKKALEKLEFAYPAANLPVVAL